MRRNASPRTCTPRAKRRARASATVDLPAAEMPVISTSGWASRSDTGRTLGTVSSARPGDPVLDRGNERSFTGGVGRIAGVTAEDTRARLVAAAAETFATRGYEGTRVADIATAAGVSNGALYSHFSSKAELLAEAVRDHASHQLAALFLDDPDRSLPDLLVTLGSSLADRGPGRGGLVVEALVAARRDPEVAQVVAEHLGRRDEWITELVRAGQDDGSFASTLAPEVVSRFCLMLLLGSLLVPAASLPPVPADDWSRAHRPPRRRRGPHARRDPHPRRCPMKVHVDQDRCQGHGRCYALAPDLFEPDDIGNGVEVGDGTVPTDRMAEARLAVANCPEQAIDVEEHA